METVESKMGTFADDFPAVAEKLQPAKTEATPSADTITIAEVRDTIQRHFPKLWGIVEVGIANFSTLLLKNNSNCSAIVIEGDSSCGKNTALKMFYPSKDTAHLLYRSDDFTPKCFVSHHANKSEKERQKADMLPKLSRKMLVYSDLQTTFSKREEDQTESLGMLGKVLDGEGLTRDTGTCGQRGYVDDNYIFASLFATTPIGWKTWEIMSRCGTRLMFYKVDVEDIEVSQQKANLQHDFYDAEISYYERVKICRDAVQRCLLSLWNRHGGFASVEFKDSQVKENVREEIATLAVFVTRARGQLRMWEIKGTEDFDYEPPRIEKPERIMTLLLNIGKGFAIMHGKDLIDEDGYFFLKHIALSSMPQNRYVILKYMLAHQGRIGTEEDLTGYGLSYRLLLRAMTELVALGLAGWEVNEDGGIIGRPRKRIRLNTDFGIF